ncbi:hypothetical protein [Streptomyces murinus]|uniref:hypothetical protein n=1 Tax=Streptomyces murinus TaxID=33900 RepID=UPI0037F1C791
MKFNKTVGMALSASAVVLGFAVSSPAHAADSTPQASSGCLSGIGGANCADSKLEEERKMQELCKSMSEQERWKLPGDVCPAPSSMKPQPSAS